VFLGRKLFICFYFFTPERPPPPSFSRLAHFNIWIFAHNITKSPTNPIKHLTKFSIVILLVLEGFIGMITKNAATIHHSVKKTFTRFRLMLKFILNQSDVNRGGYYFFFIWNVFFPGIHQLVVNLGKPKVGNFRRKLRCR
jgi:hypothetical protein